MKYTKISQEHKDIAIAAIEGALSIAYAQYIEFREDAEYCLTIPHSIHVSFVMFDKKFGLCFFGFNEGSFIKTGAVIEKGDNTSYSMVHSYLLSDNISILKKYTGPKMACDLTEKLFQSQVFLKYIQESLDSINERNELLSAVISPAFQTEKQDQKPRRL